MKNVVLITGASSGIGALTARALAQAGQRPLRVHIATEPDGAEVVNAVADHIRAEFIRSMGLSDLLKTVPVR